MSLLTKAERQPGGDRVHAAGGTMHRVVFLTLSFKSLLLSIEKQKRTSLKNIQPLLGNRQRANYEKPRKQFRIFQRETIKIWHKLWHTFYETLCHIVQKITIKQGKTAQNGRFCPMAEKQGFEPWLRFSRTTPLAGEPLRPLGYFSLNRKRITKDA